MEKIFTNKIILQILEKYKPVWALNYAMALADWDASTYMPESGFTARGEAMARINSFKQKMLLDKDFINLVRKAESENDLNDYEKGILRIIKKHLRKFEKLPSEFLEEFSRVTSESCAVYKIAKKENNFSLFAPHLEKIVDLSLREAEYIGYKEHPYDALLDNFEENLKVSYLDGYFDSIRDFLIELLNDIKKSPNYTTNHSLEEEPYDQEKMRELNLKVLNFLKADFRELRLDISVHPFTKFIGRSDARITTWYHKNNFKRSLTATIHEFGHANYDLRCHPDLNYTAAEEEISFVVHESLSRFWENMIGRSRGFVERFHNDIIAIGPEMKKYSSDDIYRYLNLVSPGCLRVEADEITYHSHIIIRYEIEKELLERKIAVKDLPDVWNEKYKKYLGIKPKTSAEGVLQDVHWSYGEIGYFATYSLGTSISAQWKYYIEKDLGDINDFIKEDGGIEKILNWLNTKIHKYESIYLFNDLVKKVTGEEFTTKYLKEYLTKKYKKIY